MSSKTCSHYLKSLKKKILNFQIDFNFLEELLLLVQSNNRFHCLSFESFVSICLVLSNYNACSKEVQSHPNTWLFMVMIFVV